MNDQSFDSTHVIIDGKTHFIHAVEEHAGGPRHTHRAHLGCGMTVDIDFRGTRYAAAAATHRDTARAARARDEHALRAISEEHAGSMSRHAEAHARDHAGGAESRWLKPGGPAADCPTCASVEAGAEPATAHVGHTAARTVEADHHTGVRCPLCAGEIRKRRADGVFACTGSGHEFSPTELLAQTSDSFQRLIDLAKG